MLLNRLILLYFLMFHLVVFSSVSAAAEKETKEFLIKSVFLSKFAKFTEWPEKSGMENKQIPFVIGILGHNIFESTIKKVYSNYRINGKKVKIIDISSLKLKQIPDIHLLLLTKKENKRINSIVSKLKNKPVLTVSDTENAARHGVHISFFKTTDENIRFMINESEVKKSGLKMNLLLLEIATLVQEK